MFAQQCDAERRREDFVSKVVTGRPQAFWHRYNISLQVTLLVSIYLRFERF